MTTVDRQSSVTGPVKKYRVHKRSRFKQFVIANHLFLVSPKSCFYGDVQVGRLLRINFEPRRRRRPQILDVIVNPTMDQIIT